MPNNHGRSPRQNNGLHSDCLSYAPSSHGGYAAGLGTLRASGGDIGGGSEILIIENRGGCWTLDEKMGQTYIHNNCANTLAARDYKQPQAVIMTYQNVAGTLNPGGHPGSYNGQDAYNDMLVTDGVFNSEIRNIQSVQSSAHSVCAGLQGRNRPHNRGGR